MKTIVTTLVSFLLLAGSIIVTIITIGGNRNDVLEANIEALTEENDAYLCMKIENSICVYNYTFPPYHETVDGYHDYSR